MHASLHSLWQLTAPQRRRYGAAVALLGGGLLLSYAPALISGAAIDRAAGGSGEGSAFARLQQTWPAAAEVAAGTPARAAAFIILLTAASGVLLYMQGRLAARAAEGLAVALRDRLYDHLQRAPVTYHDRADTGDLVQRCSSDVETVRTFLSTQVIEIGRAVILIGLALPVMLWMHPRMTLVALALFPPIGVMAVVFFRKVRARFLAADEAEAVLTSVLQENLTGIRVVRAFGRQDWERKRFAKANASFRDLSEQLLRMLARYWAVSDFLCLGQVGVVLLVGGAFIRSGELTAGALFTFMAWVNLLIWPVRHAGRVITDAGKATVSLGRIGEVLAEPVEPRDDLGVEVPPPEAWAGELVLRDVHFAHGGGADVLRGVSLRAEPGETVALVGPPGAGKSTIVSLLLRLHDPDGGEIRLDGRDLADLPRRAARRLVATVLQEPFLYSRTVAENIRFGQSRATTGDVEEAARAACVHDAIETFAQGYDTLVGERGVTLSGGQRQRVALARALLRDAPLLVLDDALSAVDADTEERIRHALRRRRGRRTTVVIAHRPSTLREADRIVVLDAGRVVQDGTHDELMAVDGPYRRLWDVQAVVDRELAGDLQAAQGGAS